MHPIVLGPNQPPRFYRGGHRIAAFRGMAAGPSNVPEDWVGSTTSLFGDDREGLTLLPDGRRLVDAISEDGAAWLGPGAPGDPPALLVKLLDAGQRLPIHVHPDSGFAAEHLGSTHGKAEAWFVLDSSGDSRVFVGFRRPVDRDELTRWVKAQTPEPMLAAMNEISLRAGDSLFVPAGVPHAIDAGVLLLELQEPTDLSVLLEWRGFDIDGQRDGHLGLGFDRALDCVNRQHVDPDPLVRRGTPRTRRDRNGFDVLPVGSKDYFRAERLGADATLNASYSILVVVDGSGRLVGDECSVDIHRGMTLVVPHAAGELEIRGEVDVIRCMAPSPMTEGHESDSTITHVVRQAGRTGE